MTKETEIGCTPVPGEACPNDEGGVDDEAGGETTDTGADETGDTTGEPEELGSDQCIHNVSDEFVGIQYQCEGDLNTSITFSGIGDCGSVLGDFCVQEHVFGTNFQPYASADVIACCGPYMSEYAATYKEYCAYDMVQQVCISLAEQVQFYIESGAFGSYTQDATEVQVWIADHYKECFAALKDNNSEPLPAVVSYWELGSFGPLENVVLHIDSGTQLYGVNLPVLESEWLTCNGASGNNDQVFEDSSTPNGDILFDLNLGSDLDGDLLGPVLFGGSVSASATFEATCLPHGCPTATLSYASQGSQFTLEDLNLYTGAFDITNGTYSLTADRAQIELWSQAVGTKVHDPASGQVVGYQIPAGAAHFSVSGIADVEANRFMAVNGTDIWITYKRGVWTLGGFDIQYEDGNNDVWTIALDDSQWQ